MKTECVYSLSEIAEIHGLNLGRLENTVFMTFPTDYYKIIVDFDDEENEGTVMICKKVYDVIMEWISMNGKPPLDS